MKRLFLRFVVTLIVTHLILEVVVTVIFFSARPGDARVVEDSLRGGMRLAAQQLDDTAGPQREAECHDLEERSFGMPLTILPDIDTLPDPVPQRLQGEGAVVWYMVGDEDYTVTLLASGEVLRLGPLPEFAPSGTWRYVISVSVITVVYLLVILVLLRPTVIAARDLERASDRLMAGDYAARVDERRWARSGVSLARSFNRMAERTERLLESQRHMLQAASHELRTPLARLRFIEEMRGKARDPEELRGLGDEADESLDELEGLVEELLAHARIIDRLPMISPEEVDAGDALASLAERSAPGEEQRVVLELDDFPVGTRIHADLRLFRRAMGNLLANAVEHAAEGVVVTAAVEGEQLVIHVDDDGPGIPAEERSRVLEPFVRLNTGDLARRGAGLGLDITRRIVEQHGGRIQIDESPQQGCRVTTNWPLGSA